MAKKELVNLTIFGFSCEVCGRIMSNVRFIANVEGSNKKQVRPGGNGVTEIVCIGCGEVYQIINVSVGIISTGKMKGLN